MATPSQIKSGLDQIAVLITEQRAVVEKAQSNAANASAALAAIATDYADVITTIDAFAVNSTDYFERMAKAEKAKMQAEFIALKADADAIMAV